MSDPNRAERTRGATAPFIGICYVPWCSEDAVPDDAVCVRHQRIERFDLHHHYAQRPVGPPPPGEPVDDTAAA